MLLITLALMSTPPLVAPLAPGTGGVIYGWASAAASSARSIGRRIVRPFCSATDGDTIRCGDERIRLLGIDAPELKGHCRKGRDCAPGNPIASRRSLQQAMWRRRIKITRVSRDRYGRTVALVSSAGFDLSCTQLRYRHAIYKPQWDDGSRVRALCPAWTALPAG